MRKISKISLVAAVAVAGFSTANAQPLEEAIKNVDVSGSVVYRYDNFDNDKGSAASTDNNRYKIGLNLSSKVNDYVKFNSRFIVGKEDSYGFADTNARKGGGDGSADVSLSQAYFGFTAIPNTVVNIGKQGLTTPYTVATDINGNEQAGTGILALSTMGPVTAGAGYFNNQNLNGGSEINSTATKYAIATSTNGLSSSNDGSMFDGGADLYVATVQGDLDFVKLEAWYLGMQNAFNSYTLAATSNIDLAENAKLGLEARYVNLKLDNDVVTGDDRKNSMFRFAVDGKVSIVNARVAYTQTGKDGGLTAVDQDAKNTSLGWGISSNGIADAKYWQAALGADILDNLNFTVHYGNLKAKENVGVAANGDYKAQEVFGQLTYKMSKNLSTYLRYGNFEQKEGSTKVRDENRGRLQVAYTF
ncbi:major outer membrane protein [Aliarcobacter cryaerophilus]|uniref:major outer membrane protein n=1 Tax=Aliarcobacter cryaerophilus TaxID=28198 RepID=UPI0021B32B18|nr:major outer membrane protein [Aliarcobacter cryaerophilus]MCT7526977.1 major outer membrane protein [Aliarcobacter cryaerophilus]